MTISELSVTTRSNDACFTKMPEYKYDALRCIEMTIRNNDVLHDKVATQQNQLVGLQDIITIALRSSQGPFDCGMVLFSSSNIKITQLRFKPKLPVIK